LELALQEKRRGKALRRGSIRVSSVWDCTPKLRHAKRH
jgi:hypothetical protein